MGDGLWTMLAEGEPIMYLLVALSIGSLALIVVKIVQLWPATSGTAFAIKQFTLVRCIRVRNESKRRQPKVPADVVGRTNRIVKEIEQECQTNPGRKRKQEGNHYVTSSSGASESSRTGRGLLFDVVRPLGREGKFLFFLTDRVIVTKLAVRVELAHQRRQSGLSNPVDIGPSSRRLKC